MTTSLSANDYAYEVILQPDGKIIAAGVTNPVDGYHFAVARYLSNGALDTSFSGDGILTTDITGYTDKGLAVALQPDGRILVAGFCHLEALGYDFCLARYEPGGLLDTTFDGEGIVLTDMGSANDWAYAVAVQEDGKILAAGQRQFNGNDTHFALARYLESGALDDSFGSGGKVFTDFSDGEDRIFSVVLQPDGKIVAAGSAWSGGDTGWDNFALARYQASVEGAATLSDGEVASLGTTNVSIQLNSGGPCSFSAVKNPAPPGGAPADPGELPVQWDISSDCSTFDLDLTLEYSPGELEYGNQVDESNLWKSRFSPPKTSLQPRACLQTITALCAG